MCVLSLSTVMGKGESDWVDYCYWCCWCYNLPKGYLCGLAHCPEHLLHLLHLWFAQVLQLHAVYSPANTPCSTGVFLWQSCPILFRPLIRVSYWWSFCWGVEVALINGSSIIPASCSRCPYPSLSLFTTILLKESSYAPCLPSVKGSCPDYWYMFQKLFRCSYPLLGRCGGRIYKHPFCYAFLSGIPTYPFSGASLSAGSDPCLRCLVA